MLMVGVTLYTISTCFKKCFVRLEGSSANSATLKTRNRVWVLLRILSDDTGT